MKDSILFLSGRYQARHFDFYRKLCRGKFKVAVDGGYRFFARSGVIADLLLGDLDSLKRVPSNLPSRTRVITFPSDKNKSDAHLALEYCFKARAQQIDIVQPTVGEPDHFTGNLFLLSLAAEHGHRKYQPCVRIISPFYEIRYIHNAQHTIEKGKGDTVSIVPISKQIAMSCTGTAYDVNKLKVTRGETVSLRNRVVASIAVFRITGEALFFRIYNRH